MPTWKFMEGSPAAFVGQFHMRNKKNAFFDDFSNFLQSLRYCFGYQNPLNQAYLKAFGRNLRPRTRFSHHRMMWEISQFRPKSPSEAKLPYQTKMRRKQKNASFDGFSNFLQSLRWCFGYQNPLNQAYLKGFGQFEAQNTIFTPTHDVGDQSISAKILFWSEITISD